MKERRDEIRRGIIAIAEVQSAIQELLADFPFTSSSGAADRCRNAAGQMGSAAAVLRASTPLDEPALVADKLLVARGVALELARSLCVDGSSRERLPELLARLEAENEGVVELARDELAPFLPHRQRWIRLPPWR